MKPLNTLTRLSWQEALRDIRELASRREINDSNWFELLDWLLASEFDGTSFLAGEAAALLIRDRAPVRVKRQLDHLTEIAELWPLYWRLIFLPENHPDRLQTIDKCCMSPILLIQQRGVIAKKSQSVSSLSDERALPRSVNRTVTRKSQPVEMAQGTIKTLTDKGFGFISTNGKKDLFFHSKSLQGVQFEELYEGQKVSFCEGQGPKGPCAENVKQA